jgi:hypothetical protein
MHDKENKKKNFKNKENIIKKETKNKKCKKKNEKIIKET